jgi:hypothetical protein
VTHLSTDLRNYESLIAHTEAQLESLRDMALSAKCRLKEAESKLMASHGVKVGLDAIKRAACRTPDEIGVLILTLCSSS